MRHTEAASQGFTHESFSVTEAPKPWVTVPTQFKTFAASVQMLGGRKVGTTRGRFVAPNMEEHRRTYLEGPPIVELTGQEFLLFRSLHDVPGIEPMAHRFGLLDLDFLVHPFVDDPSGELVDWGWPMWVLQLTEHPAKYLNRNDAPRFAYRWEPVEDWIRQAALLGLAWSLLGLLRDPEAAQKLTEALDAEAEPAWWGLATSWPIREFFEALDRLSMEMYRSDPSQIRLEPLPAHFSEAAPGYFESSIEVDFAVPTSIATALRDLLSPWMQLVQGDVVVSEASIEPAVRTRNELLGILWLQLANAAFTQLRPRRCAWERCPGPPSRPGVFLWQWGAGSKHKDAEFCDPRCAHAAASARSRRSPAYTQPKKRPARPKGAQE
jgi:hypothetical protein